MQLHERTFGDGDLGQDIFILPETDDSAALPTIEQWPDVIERALSLIWAAATGDVFVDEDATEKRRAIQ